MIKKNNIQYGFTLIEVLVVLVIVAIITAVAVLAFGDFGRGRSEKIHVETFVRMLSVAQSQAILTPAIMGLSISSKGYHFYRWVEKKSGAKWHPLKGSVLMQPIAFAQFSTVHVKKITGYDPVIGQGSDSPAIIFLPSGYVTPFVLKLSGHDRHFSVTVTSNGSVTVK